MIADNWTSPSKCRIWLVVGIALLFFAVALNGEAGEAKQKKHPAAKAKSAAKKTKPEEKGAKLDKAAKSYDIVFEEFKLKNGLRVLLAEDHRAPTFSIAMT